jgi:hypothetical protein
MVCHQLLECLKIDLQITHAFSIYVIHSFQSITSSSPEVKQGFPSVFCLSSSSSSSLACSSSAQVRSLLLACSSYAKFAQLALARLSSARSSLLAPVRSCSARFYSARSCSAQFSCSLLPALARSCSARSSSTLCMCNVTVSTLVDPIRCVSM